MDIRKREAMNAARTAFGADYEANLRKEAGPNPEKLARRKHQISSLYHQAKMKVTVASYLHHQAGCSEPFLQGFPLCLVSGSTEGLQIQSKESPNH